MNYQSPLKDFCVVVEQVIETAFTSPGNEILTNNEAATRAALIDPILRKLGWDISDPAMVEVEKRAPSHKNDVVADYVLKNQDGMPVVCVEAKSKGTNLKKCAPKLLQYTNAFKDTVKYALLTDGLVWQFYDCTNMNAHQEFDLASNHFGGAVSFALFMLGKFDAAHYWEPELLPDPLQKIEDLRSDLDSVKKELNSLRKALESPVKPAWSFENSKHAELPFINLNEIEKKMPDTGMRWNNLFLGRRTSDTFDIGPWNRPDQLGEHVLISLVMNGETHLGVRDGFFWYAGQVINLTKSDFDDAKLNQLIDRFKNILLGINSSGTDA